ncbi:MAG TPA: hypothetical protein VIM03_05255, partial [Thermoleophilaceae bacterium]
PAVIDDGEQGLLVAEHDLDGLAAALDALLSDAGLRERLGREAARRAAEELDVSACTVELERIYDRLV